MVSALSACSPAQPEPAADSKQSALPAARHTAQAVQTASTGPQVSYELAVNPWAAPGAQHESTAIAAGNGIYLVVWMEYFNGPPDIFGVRVRASDGQPLDSSPLRIGTGSTVQYQPAVAFDGTNFLVVWEDIRSAPAIYGARVRASDGVVLDSSPLYISRTPMGGYNFPEQAPAVAFDGTNYLVTWHGYYSFATGPMTGIQAIRVRPSDGSCVESNSTFVAANGSNSRVAYTDGAYLVTWTRNNVVEATRISAATGQPVDSTITTLGPASSNLRYSAVAGQGGEFLVTWIGTDSTLWARRVSASDGAKLDSADSSLGIAALTPPEATFDGADYRILWQGSRNGIRKVLTTRVSSQGVVAADAESVLAEVIGSPGAFRGGIAATAPGSFLTSYTNHDAASGSIRGQMRLVAGAPSSVSAEVPVSITGPGDAVQSYSAVGVGNGIYLVVWSESSSSYNRAPDILGVRVRASDGVRLDMTPLYIGTTSDTEIQPSVAFDGTNFLVAWVQMGSTSPLIYGARVRASDGAVLDPLPFLISRMPDASGYDLPQFNPAVGFDGTNYLVVWSGNYFADPPTFPHNSPVYGVQGIHVRPDGTLVEPSRLIIAPGGGVPQLAYANGNYLITWDSGYPSSVSAMRVNAATGQVLDTPVITVASGGARTPSVASQGGEFLLTWIGSDNALRARRVRSSDGASLDSLDLTVAPYVWNAPTVAFDGVDYRIAWIDSTHGLKVLSQRVSPQGLVASDAALVISPLNSSAPTERDRIAAAGPGQFLITYTNYDAVPAKNRVRMRLVSDVQAATAPCSSGTPTLVLNGGSPLTLECGPVSYQDPGAQAFDGCGNPIAVHAYNTGTDSSGPGPNMRYEGSYTVSYAAWDALGNTANASRTVIVDDRTPPLLALKGDAHMTHTCGSQWVDPGVTASDACYGDLSAQVWHTGEVNGWAAGTYTVTYTLTDSGGNSAVPITRTVDVVNCPW